ncbi:DUF2590 family protein [Marinibactrum halimedae]|uniref:DUF2590 family protein n=1 Tax=Marinibactrum halimedae TaxID=1444977 RepID=A0AA37T9T5_9GAMM|nr:DUF2590 family protein [Marinibactrum halimedae]MCD9458458.1 DUF2590 family protein [Marinibactrum halimedae]GLS26155.1 hypothetical protein GCM10007877_18700 [Marinibactrum halimedae]
MQRYDDFLIENGDLVLDAIGEPVLCRDRVSIGQDIKHRIIESGLALQFIDERDANTVAQIKNKIIMLVNNDTRIWPGTARLLNDERTPGVYWLTATTRDYGTLEVAL